jgi:Arc/MetJ-type ribon-helix-helix transcriptional regulator
MQIELTIEQREFIRHAIDAGRLRAPEDAVREALDLWIEQERCRAELLAAIDEAEASLAREEPLPITAESMRALAEDVKRRGRLRDPATR